jgi:hypothetical protein
MRFSALPRWRHRRSNQDRVRHRIMIAGGSIDLHRAPFMTD